MATVEYQPQGRGFEVQLAAGSLELVVRGTGLHDGDPEICGSSELTGNVALVALVLGYAANELAYRRSRSPEKRVSHRKAADVERKDVLGLSDLVVRLDERTVSAWCSGCFTKTTRRHVQGANVPKGHTCARSAALRRSSVLSLVARTTP